MLFAFSSNKDVEKSFWAFAFGGFVDFSVVARYVDESAVLGT